jgi:hypothetical protein
MRIGSELNFLTECGYERNNNQYLGVGKGRGSLMSKGYCYWMLRGEGGTWGTRSLRATRSRVVEWRNL